MTTDNLMRWDSAKERYVLTEQAALQNNVDLRMILNVAGVPARNNLPEQVLDRISKTVYNFIYLHGDKHSKDRQLQEFDEYYRQFIYDAMIEQLLYFEGNGMLNLTSRVNVSTGLVIDRAAKMDAAYAPEMVNVLNQCGILYCGFTPSRRGL